MQEIKNGIDRTHHKTATLYRARVIATYNLHLLVGCNSLFLMIQSKIGFVGYMRTLSNDKPLDAPKFNVGYAGWVSVLLLGRN